VEVEGADVDAVAGLGEEHGAQRVPEGDGDHRGGRLPAAACGLESIL
jgi:hypothetical protein